MRNTVNIENIEEMRRRAGIDDVELREKIGRLRVGDTVKLTFLAATTSCGAETLLVQITRIRSERYHGKLIENPTSRGLANLRIGSAISFTAAQIHSLPKGQPADEP
jgi:hypothetical protein